MKERSWLYAPRRMKTFWWVLAWLGIFVALMFVAGVAGGIILHGQDSGKAGERVGALFGWVLGFAAYGLAYWLSEIEVLPPPGPVGHTLALTLSCICGLGSALLGATAIFISDLIDVFGAAGSATHYNQTHAGVALVPLSNGPESRLGIGIRLGP